MYDLNINTKYTQNININRYVDKENKSEETESKFHNYF